MHRIGKKTPTILQMTLDEIHKSRQLWMCDLSADRWIWCRECCSSAQRSPSLEMQPQVLAATRLRKERIGYCLGSKKITWGGARWQSECLREKGQEENWRWSGMNGGWSWIHRWATCWAPPDTLDSLIDFI